VLPERYRLHWIRRKLVGLHIRDYPTALAYLYELTLLRNINGGLHG
jgi:hypothetical protein